MDAIESDLPVTRLPSGVSVTVLGAQAYDWRSIRVLAEKGVPYAVIARHFKLPSANAIAVRAKREKWVTPRREAKMQRELLKRQTEALESTGEVRDPEEVMAEIWQERQRTLDEKAWNIVEGALNGVSEEMATGLIAEAKDLKTIVDVGRKVTGQDKRDAEDLERGPTMAINVGFLRSTGPDVAPIEV